MHDPTLDKKERDPLDLSPVQKNYIEETTAGLAKHFRISSSRATIALGYVMQMAESYPSVKDAIMKLDWISKKPITLMNEDEKQAMLAIGHLVRKLPPFQSETKNIGRNAPCPCESGKKFKNCCLSVAKLNEVERYKNGNK